MNNHRCPNYPSATARHVRHVPPVTGNCFVPVYHHVMVLSEAEKKRILGALTAKLARTKRRMARHLRANLKLSATLRHHRSNSSSSSSPSSSSPQTEVAREDQEEEVMANGSDNLADIETEKDVDVYSFCTPDNKRLRMVLKKELKKSDVGSLGRIVLPKREAENRLPIIGDKEGVQVVIKEIYSNNQWPLRYKYWSNNKSRMYVLENTGDFVRQNGLEIGDSITLYEDEFKNLYVALKKGNKIKPSKSEGPCQSTEAAGNNDSLYSHLFASKIDDDTSSPELFLTEAANYSCDTYNLSGEITDHTVGDSANSCTGQWKNEVKYASLSHCVNDAALGDDGTYKAQAPHQASTVDERFFDDCYGELGMLPEVNGYRYYDYLALFDDIASENP